MGLFFLQSTGLWPPKKGPNFGVGPPKGEGMFPADPSNTNHPLSETFILIGMGFNTIWR